MKHSTSPFYPYGASVARSCAYRTHVFEQSYVKYWDFSQG
jgi:hypothetical protein